MDGAPLFVIDIGRVQQGGCPGLRQRACWAVGAFGSASLTTITYLRTYESLTRDPSKYCHEVNSLIILSVLY